MVNVGATSGTRTIFMHPVSKLLGIQGDDLASRQLLRESGMNLVISM